MMINDEAEDSLGQIKRILIRDLKLEDSRLITDDMPLIGGDFDLDSLDILLLVTSIERHFGIKIPNESIGREAFANVATLAAFVEQQRGCKAA
jgi:acyl carrier protein